MRPSRLSDLLVAGASFAYLLAYPLAIGRADESHLLYGAKRVLDGQVIYRDFFEGITPLGFYLFAALYGVAGTTLLAARTLTAGVVACGGALLFRLVRRIAGTGEAAVAALAVVALCFPAWPYASAHWLSTTLGLAVAAVTLSTRHAGSSRGRPALAGALAGAAVSVQQQRGVFLALWLPLALLVLASGHPGPERWRRAGRELAWAFAGGASVVLPILGHAAWAASPGAMVEMLYGFAVSRYAPSQTGRHPWAAVLLLTEPWARATWLWVLRAAPLGLVAEGALLLHARARRGWGPPERVRVALWLLAAWMAASVLYLPDFIHVAFVLPFLLVPCASAFAALRSWPGWTRVPAGRRAITVALWAFAATLAGHAIANLTYARVLAPARFATAFGELRGSRDVERLFRTVRRHLVREPDGRALLYSYPDDAWLYLALPADDATRFSVLVADFFPEAYLEEVLDAIRARRPGTVVLALPFTPERVRRAVESGYDAVEDVWAYRVYVRRPPADLPDPTAGG